MDILHRIADQLAVRHRQTAIRRGLNRLNARALADVGLKRDEIAAVAQVGARLGPEGARLSEVVARVRAAGTRPLSFGDQLFGSLEQLSAYRAGASSYDTAAFSCDAEHIHTVRAATATELVRWVRRGLASAVRPVTQAVADSTIGRQVTLGLVWRRAHRQIRDELETYSDRELMADLRLARSQIADIAAEAADEHVAAFVAANPAYRRVAARRGEFGRVTG